MDHEPGGILLCDGTRAGLLTALFHAEASRPRARGILLEMPGQISFIPPEKVETNEAYATRVWRAIEEKLPEEAALTFDMVYASREIERGSIIMRYLRHGWRLGMKLEDAVNEPDVFVAMRLRNRVGFEIHKLKGLLRFARIQGDIYYSSIEPDHDILPYLAEHFVDRLADQRFVIHDVSRGKAALYRPEGSGYVIMPMDTPPKEIEKEDREFRLLWKGYFQTIAIQERINPRLQRQYMPARYWKHLHEMQNI